MHSKKFKMNKFLVAALVMMAIVAHFIDDRYL